MGLYKTGRVDKNCRPDFQSFTIVINAYANSSSVNKAVHARRLLKKLLHMVQAGELDMTRNSAAPFSAVINAAARTQKKRFHEEETYFDDGRDKVEALCCDPYAIAMQTYFELRDDVYNIGAAPDHHTFAALLRCIALHCLPGSIERDRASKLVYDDACESGHVSKLVIKEMKCLWSEEKLEGDQWNFDEIPRFWSRKVPQKFR